MNFTEIGHGYIGLVSDARLAELGNDIACMNIDSRKIDIFNYADALNIVTEWRSFKITGFSIFKQRRKNLGKHRFIQAIASRLIYIGSISTRPLVPSEAVGSMRTDLIGVSLAIFDGRNIFEPSRTKRLDIKCCGIGRISGSPMC